MNYICSALKKIMLKEFLSVSAVKQSLTTTVPLSLWICVETGDYKGTKLSAGGPNQIFKGKLCSWVIFVKHLWSTAFVLCSNDLVCEGEFECVAAVMKLLVKVAPTLGTGLSCVWLLGDHDDTHTLIIHTHIHSESLLHYAHGLLISCHLSIRWEPAREYGNERLARKIKLSLLLSSLSPFSPSLQTDDRSKLLPSTLLFFLHPSSLNHFFLYENIFIQ